jgi:DNA adenine methylase
MNSLSVDVRPVKPAAGYIGGKRNLAGRLVKIIDTIEHRSYAEPFVGMGGIFLRRRKQVPAEFINDISGDVANFFRVLQVHYPYFLNEMRFMITSRHEFERLRAMPADRLTDIHRAVRFLYLQRLAFGGKVSGRNFGVDARAPARFNITSLERDLDDIRDRLSRVVIEQLNYADFIRRYDTAETLFYLDPPYWGCETDYGQDVFSRDDFNRLAEQLRGVRGKVLISINDTPGVRECFAGMHMLELATTYQIGLKAKKVGELLISNFAIGAVA